MQKDYEEALKAREDKGKMNLITGALAVTVGVTAIVVTAGTATPIVVTAAVAGTCSTAYGVSNMIEGGQDLYYASIGDIESAAINPIRDTVFMGNQSAYDVWGNLSMTVAATCMPVANAVSSATTAGKSTMLAAGKAVGKEYLVDKGTELVSSNITNYATQCLGLDPTGATLLNIGTSMVVGSGIDGGGSKLSGGKHISDAVSNTGVKNLDNIPLKVDANIKTSGISDVNAKNWDFTTNKAFDYVKVDKVETDVNVQLKAPEVTPKSNTVKVEPEKVDVNTKIADTNTDNLSTNKLDEHVEVNKVNTDDTVKMNADETATQTKVMGDGAESGSKTEVIMPSKPHTNGTQGHWETILDEVDVMKNSGDYSKIYVNKGLSNEIPGAKPNRRPDIMGVRNNGLIDQVEVPSKTDIPDLLIDRMIDNQCIIGDRAGSIKIRNIGGN